METTAFTQAYFYTLSALLQGFAALITLVGMFVIFRLQLLKDEIKRCEGALGIAVAQAYLDPYDSRYQTRLSICLAMSIEDLLKDAVDKIASLDKDIKAINEKDASSGVMAERMKKEFKKSEIQNKLDNLNKILPQKDIIIKKINLPIVLNALIVGLSALLLPFAEIISPISRLFSMIGLIIFSIAGLIATVKVALELIKL